MQNVVPGGFGLDQGGQIVAWENPHPNTGRRCCVRVGTTSGTSGKRCKERDKGELVDLTTIRVTVYYDVGQAKEIA